MDNYSIEHIKGASDQFNQLIFSGELSFSYIQFIKDELDNIFNTKEAYKILVKDVDILDLSFIQLLISIKQCNSNSTIELQINDEITELIKVSGFKDLLI